MKLTFREKLFSASAYICGIPALYFVLTKNRKNSYLGYHGARALFLWFIFFVIFFSIRLLVNLFWSMYYVPGLEKIEILAAVLMGCYAIFCGYQSFR